MEKAEREREDEESGAEEVKDAEAEEDDADVPALADSKFAADFPFFRALFPSLPCPDDDEVTGMFTRPSFPPSLSRSLSLTISLASMISVKS